MEIRNIHSILPTDDADFISHALSLFSKSNVDAFIDETLFDKSAMFIQINNKLHKKGISYKVYELIFMQMALRFYMQTVHNRESKLAVAERLSSALEENLEPFLE